MNAIVDLSFLSFLSGGAALPAIPAGPMRVRQILDGIGGTGRRSLNKHLPNKDVFVSPAYETQRYPSALLSALEKPNQYSQLGLIAEAMLGLTVPEITIDSLLSLVASCVSNITADGLGKIRKSKTTQPFLDALIATRTKMDVRGALEHEPELAYDQFVGHPDYRTPTQIFEVKLTNKLDTNWAYFIYQTFAYAALDPAVTDVHIVLPLQSQVWHFNVSTWASRTAYRDALNAAAKKLRAPAAAGPTMDIATHMAAARLCNTYRIGHHAPKLKSLLGTVQEFPDPCKPYQIFLGSPTASRMSAVSDADCAATRGFIDSHALRVYVHSPYIINLATTVEDGWNVALLRKNLECANAIGCRGVVVHVGKSTKQSYASALDTMRANISRCLEVATPDCPLLLETPAGQGTEMLRPIAEFLEFVASFDDPRIRVCIDTCHVFACGHDPIEYINAAGGLTHLIHFNDSMEPCGSCKDRHAPIGAGKLGLERMTAIATRGSELNIPMLVE